MITCEARYAIYLFSKIQHILIITLFSKALLYYIKATTASLSRLNRRKWFTSEFWFLPFLCVDKKYLKNKMKFALVLLTCFFSVAWQQNVQWAPSNIRMPFYPYLDQLFMPIYESILVSDPRHLRYSNLLAVKNSFSYFFFLSLFWIPNKANM